MFIIYFMSLPEFGADIAKHVGSLIENGFAARFNARMEIGESMPRAIRYTNNEGCPSWQIEAVEFSGSISCASSVAFEKPDGSLVVRPDFADLDIDVFKAISIPRD